MGKTIRLTINGVTDGYTVIGVVKAGSSLLDVYKRQGQEELRRIAAEQETVEMKCQFCNKAYHLHAADYVKREEAQG